MEIITPNKIREFRLANNLSQKDLAHRLNQHTSCVSGWELGKWGPTKKIIPALTKMIVEWESKTFVDNIEFNDLKKQLKQTKDELQRYKSLCDKQDRLIDKMLKLKEEWKALLGHQKNTLVQ